MTDKTMEKLLKASTLACKENLQHLLIVFTKDVYTDEELLTAIHSSLAFEIVMVVQLRSWELDMLFMPGLKISSNMLTSKVQQSPS